MYEGGHSPRQGLEKLLLASGHMWIKPVARMTPAPKALSMKKIGLPVAAYGLILPAQCTSCEPCSCRQEAFTLVLFSTAVCRVLDDGDGSG